MGTTRLNIFQKQAQQTSIQFTPLKWETRIVDKWKTSTRLADCAGHRYRGYRHLWYWGGMNDVMGLMPCILVWESSSVICCIRRFGLTSDHTISQFLAGTPFRAHVSKIRITSYFLPFQIYICRMDRPTDKSMIDHAWSHPFFSFKALIIVIVALEVGFGGPGRRSGGMMYATHAAPRGFKAPGVDRLPKQLIMTHGRSTGYIIVTFQID